MNSNRLDMLLDMYDDSSHDSFILFAIAKEYEYLGNNVESISQFEKLRTLDPSYTGLYFHLANLYQTEENFDMALKIYDEGITIAKKQADFHALSELLNAKQNLEIEM